MLAQTLAASTCFQHSSGPMLCRTLIFSLPEWFAVVNVTHSPVMCRPWAWLWLFYFQNWMPYWKWQAAWYRADTGPSFGWRSVNLNSRQRPPSSVQHLTDANVNTRPITIADSWLPRLGQYCAVLSASAIRTWVTLENAREMFGLGIRYKGRCRHLHFAVSKIQCWGHY